MIRTLTLAGLLIAAPLHAQPDAACENVVAAIRAIDPHNGTPDKIASAIAIVRSVCAERFPD